MKKFILFSLVTMLAVSSCAPHKDTKSGVIIGKDSVTITRTISRKIYDSMQIRIMNSPLKGFSIDAVSAAYQAKVALDPKQYSLTQITMNSDLLAEICSYHRIIRLVPAYFPADPRNPANPQDKVALLLGFEDGGTPEWHNILSYFNDSDYGMKYTVFCPPPGSCIPSE